MKSIFRATAILSGSSIVSILVNLATAKVMAVCLQPIGYGYYGLLQNFVGIASLLAGVGVATGIVRMGAAPAKENDLCAIAALRRATWLIFAGTGLVAAFLIVALRRPLTNWALGSPAHGYAIALMTIPILLVAARNICMGTMNAYHYVAALAKCNIASTVAMAVTTLPIILVLGRKGIVAAVIADAAAAFLIYRYYMQGSVGSLSVRPSWTDTLKAVRSLLKFGGPYTASMLMGSGVQLALPILVLHLLGAESVGYYRAATAISFGYLGFLVTAMGQDYYPRVSAAARRPKEMVRLINEQHRLVLLLSVPMVLGAMTLMPYLVPLIYSSKFMPTVSILEWQVMGDLFRFAGWTMSCAVLAHSGAVKYLMTETLSGVASLASLWIWVRWFGIPGLGIAFLSTYVVYYCGAWLIARHELPLVWTKFNRRALIGGLGVALIIRLLPSTSLSAYRTPIALGLTAAVAIPIFFIVLREFKESSRDAIPAV